MIALVTPRLYARTFVSIWRVQRGYAVSAVTQFRVGRRDDNVSDCAMQFLISEPIDVSNGVGQGAR